MSKPWDKLRVPPKPEKHPFGPGCWVTATGCTVDVRTINQGGMDFQLSQAGMVYWSWEGIKEFRDFLSEVLKDRGLDPQ